MRKMIVCACLLACFAMPIFAVDWMTVNQEADGTVFYIDPSSITAKGGIRTATLRRDEKDMQIIATIDMDIAHRNFYITEAWVYLKGDEIGHAQTVPNKHHRIISVKKGTSMEKVYDIIAGKQL